MASFAAAAASGCSSSFSALNSSLTRWIRYFGMPPQRMFARTGSQDKSILAAIALPLGALGVTLCELLVNPPSLQAAGILGGCALVSFATLEILSWFDVHICPNALIRGAFTDNFRSPL